MKNVDGSENHLFTIRGKNTNGKTLKSIVIPAQEFDKMQWISEYWGTKAIVINTSIFKTLVRIKILSREHIKHETKYGYVGFVKQNNNPLKYVDNAGCITKNKYDNTTKSYLTGKFSNYKLPPPTKKEKDRQECIREILGMTKIAPNNPYIGIVCQTTAIRAVLNIYVPISVSHFIVGETGARKSALASVVQAFFGSKFSLQTQLPAEWEDTENALQDMSTFIRDSVLVIDDFIPTNSNTKELFNKAERVFRGAANRTSRHRSKQNGSLRQKAPTEAMVLATGESVTISLSESLLKRIIFFPIEKDDIDLLELTRYQELSNKSVLAQFTASLITFLLINHRKLKSSIPKKFNEYRKNAEKELSEDVHPRVHDNVASLMIALNVLYYFALKNGVINKKETKQMMSISWKQLLQLARKQTQIVDGDSLSNLFFDYLKKGLTHGDVHLLDYSTGHRLKVNELNKLGWERKPKGACIGWYDTKTKNVYIKSSNDVFKVLLDLIPEGFKHKISENPKKFWKMINATGGLSSTEKSRNTVRKTNPRTKEPLTVYCLSINIFLSNY